MLPKVLFRNSWILGGVFASPVRKWPPFFKNCQRSIKAGSIIKIIEIDEEKELTQVNRIRLIPTQIFFDSKNKEVFRHEGFMDKEAIKKIFQQMGVQ